MEWSSGERAELLKAFLLNETYKPEKLYVPTSEFLTLGLRILGFGS